MDLKNILQYQKKDSELIKLEKEFNSNENKRIYTQMISVVKDAQNKSSELERKAGELISNYELLKKSYKDNIKSAGIVANKNAEKSSLEDLSTMEEIAKTICENLSILEKKLLAQAEKANAMLQDFDQTKKKYNLAREKYNKHKELFDEESKKLEPLVSQKKEEIKKLEADIDMTLLTKYKQKRQDRIYPVFVPFIEKTCGGCRMELPSASISKLKQEKILECEHCRRIIYINE